LKKVAKSQTTKPAYVQAPSVSAIEAKAEIEGLIRKAKSLIDAISNIAGRLKI